MRRSWGIAVAIAAPCAPANALGAFAGSSISGDPQGVKLAHEVMRAFARYTWATEHSTVRIHRNRVVWWLDVLRPVSGHQSRSRSW